MDQVAYGVLFDGALEEVVEDVLAHSSHEEVEVAVVGGSGPAVLNNSGVPVGVWARLVLLVFNKRLHEEHGVIDIIISIP